MTDHSPDHAERAEVMRLARAAFAMEVSMIERDARISDLTDDETDSIIDGVLAAARAAALRGRDAVGEALREHLAEQITHVEARIKDGQEMGAAVWRIALEDVARENRVALADTVRGEGENG